MKIIVHTTMWQWIESIHSRILHVLRYSIHLEIILRNPLIVFFLHTTSAAKSESNLSFWKIDFFKYTFWWQYILCTYKKWAHVFPVQISKLVSFFGDIQRSQILRQDVWSKEIYINYLFFGPISWRGMPRLAIVLIKYL